MNICPLPTELAVFRAPRPPGIKAPPTGGARGDKIWPPPFSHTMGPDLPEYAKKLILTRKSLFLE